MSVLETELLLCECIVLQEQKISKRTVGLQSLLTLEVCVCMCVYTLYILTVFFLNRNQIFKKKNRAK